jgi:hypothetical protein
MKSVFSPAVLSQSLFLVARWVKSIVFHRQWAVSSKKTCALPTFRSAVNGNKKPKL